MTIKEGIFKSIEGGWKCDPDEPVSSVLLQPLFWQAIGKVEGWQGKNQPSTDMLVLKAKMYLLVNSLCDGLTLEEAFNKATL